MAADDRDPRFLQMLDTVPGFRDLSQEEQDRHYAATLFMDEAYQASAAEWSAFGTRLETHATTRGEVTPSRMRAVGDYLFHAAGNDPFTQLQDGLAGSGNELLRARTFTEGGGFVAHRQEFRVIRRERDAALAEGREPVPQAMQLGGRNNLEFHPPGGIHVEGHPDDTHGSYLRPAGRTTQRSMSFGPHDFGDNVPIIADGSRARDADEERRLHAAGPRIR